MPTALLAGAFGQGNLGDEALLQAFAAALPNWRMVATTSDLDSTDIVEPTTGLSHFEGVPARRPLAVASKALKADALIVGGGTIFKLLDPATGRRPRGLLANASALVASASLMGRPVAMVGVGAGELHGSIAGAYTRFLIRRSDLLIIRDEESAGRLASAGATGPFRVGADPAWTLLAPPEASRARPTRRVLTVPSREAAASVGGTEPLVNRLVAALARVRAAGNEIWLQAWQQLAPTGLVDDVSIVAALERRLAPDVQVLPTPRSLPEAVESMKDFGSVLSYRFHSLIAAGAAGTAVVAVTHEPKLAGLARRLSQTAVDPRISADHLADAILASIGSAGPAPAAVKEEIGRAEEGFRLLRILLSGGTEESDQLGALPLVSWPD